MAKAEVAFLEAVEYFRWESSEKKVINFSSSNRKNIMLFTFLFFYFFLLLFTLLPELHKYIKQSECFCTEFSGNSTRILWFVGEIY